MASHFDVWDGIAASYGRVRAGMIFRLRYSKLSCTVLGGEFQSLVYTYEKNIYTFVRRLLLDRPHPQFLGILCSESTLKAGKCQDRFLYLGGFT